MTKDGRDKRMKVWRHNALIGGVAMAQANMRAIARADTVTVNAKAEAESIHAALTALRSMLKTRI